MAAGLIAVCPAVELEFLYSARSLADRLHKQHLLRQVVTWVPMSDQACERAEQVQQRLTDHGHHRSAGALDLLIAATAEPNRLIMLCEDRGFEVVARITDQPVRFVSQT